MVFALKISSLEGLEVPNSTSKLSSGSSKHHHNNHNDNNKQYIDQIENKKNNLKEYIQQVRYNRFRTSRVEGSEGREGSKAVDNSKNTISVTEASQILGKSTKSIYAWCKSGKLKAWRGQGPTGEMWFIDRASVEAVREVQNVEVWRVEEGSEVPTLEVERVEEPRQEMVPKAEVYEMAVAVVEKIIENKIGAIEKNFSEVSEELRKVVSDLRQENGELRERLEKDAEHFRGRLSRVDEFIEQYREKQNKRPWWKFWQK